MLTAKQMKSAWERINAAEDAEMDVIRPLRKTDFDSYDEKHGEIIKKYTPLHFHVNHIWDDVKDCKQPRNEWFIKFALSFIGREPVTMKSGDKLLVLSEKQMQIFRNYGRYHSCVGGTWYGVIVFDGKDYYRMYANEQNYGTPKHLQIYRLPLEIIADYM